MNNSARSAAGGASNSAARPLPPLHPTEITRRLKRYKAECFPSLQSLLISFLGHSDAPIFRSRLCSLFFSHYSLRFHLPPSIRPLILASTCSATLFFRAFIQINQAAFQSDHSVLQKDSFLIMSRVRTAISSSRAALRNFQAAGSLY